MDIKETKEYFWLSNIPEAKIADFGNKYSYEYFWNSIGVDSKGEVRIQIMCEDRWGYPEEFNLTAYGNIDIVEVLSKLDKIDAFVSDWINIVKEANEGKTFNGTTYEEALIERRNISAQDQTSCGLN